MNLKNSSIAIFVKDIEVSKEFYHNLLGLEIEFDFGKNIIFKGGVAIWEINPNHIIPSKLGDRCANASSNRFELYFETENLEEAYKSIKASNISFLHELHEENWGQRTIRFFDPDNHLIEIGESLRCFIKRMLDSGMTQEQVSAKTGVALVDFEKILGE
ncbi:MAG: glyoxalase [Bacteroidales bacterium]|nr:MAG: glyoxalase [Bacteroidales bacterium]